MSNTIEYLEWDSKFFGKRVGVVRTDHPIESPKTLLSNDYGLVYVFSTVDQGEAWKKHLVEERKTLHTLTKPFTVDKSNIRPLSAEHLAELVELCLIAGHESRFKKDKKLAPYFTALYTKWADRCLEDMSYGYFVNNKLVAFTSFHNNRFDLMGVQPKHRGKGIARKLHNYSSNQLYLNGIPDLMVTTQGSNDIALKFFENVGYLPFSKEFIYHLHSGY